LLSSGHGKYGINVDGSSDDRYSFLPVGQEQSPFFKTKKLVYVSAGEKHCAALDSYGNVHLWGDNKFG